MDGWFSEKPALIERHRQRDGPHRARSPCSYVGSLHVSDSGSKMGLAILAEVRSGTVGVTACGLLTGINVTHKAAC